MAREVKSAKAKPAKAKPTYLKNAKPEYRAREGRPPLNVALLRAVRAKILANPTRSI